MHDVATQSQPTRATVGRVRELSELDELLGRAAAGAGSVVMLTGEPGIGKTRYGAGGDVLWRHANLDAQTHDWTAREFGFAPMDFLAQMARSVRAGHLVPVDGLEGLPSSYVDAPLHDATPWTFLASSRNRLFTADSQRRTFAWFDERQPGAHRLQILDGYGHLDLFYARDAHERAFPVLLTALEG